MNNIVLSKYLFNKALNAWQPSDLYSNGLTVTLLQDSAELLIWAIVKKLDVDVKSKEGFVSLIEKIDREHDGIKLKAQILEVNNSRVNFKHYGNIPSTSDISKFIDDTRTFLIINSEKIGYNFLDISLADIVNKQSVKELIKTAEKLLYEENIEESLIHISMAFSEIEYDSKKSIYTNLPNVERLWELFPEKSQDKARMFFKQTENFLDEFTWLTSLMNLGFSRNQIFSIRNKCFEVNISVTGKRLGIHPRSQTEISKENVEYLIRMITDLAIAQYG
ncbi:MAG: hypothetical protein A3J84_07590 [Ignavibacteria bacterium RIFOXYA2_FULL_37_17]|nr:MAG: hypothetical protein A3J84_07590 [Ignavibacteria bacterium RIFOXYA2_FULL_37_17]